MTRIRLWKARENDEPKFFPDEKVHHPGEIANIVFSSGGKHLASYDKTNMIEWELNNGPRVFSVHTDFHIYSAIAVAISSSMLMYLIAPGALEEALAGEMEGMALDDGLGIQLSALVGIPLVLAVVTLLVSDRVSRSANLVAGLLFGFLAAYGA